ncbi:hypothetical protein T02_11822 [Trichinella nativa]|uniref:Uncharacterized protein n=1 Tax=Trichinella nativa TaxID=6335 RepID=A0A0V1KK00_9BILA|nr:hypothetical protein T02_11822 [Trichinella nativa]
MAALLCARLKKYLERELTLSIQEITYWSDSRVAVAENLHAGSLSLQTECKKYRSRYPTPQCWRYCLTKENPADIPSRGCSLDTLINTAFFYWSFNACFRNMDKI